MDADTRTMPVDLVARAAHPAAERVVIVRRRCGVALLDAELRAAPDHELRILEEAAIAASVARFRALLREGAIVSRAQRSQYDRDCELLRRFPEDRRGIAGEGWFDSTK
jgi:hypothetical protein